jgi:hypothetical protein
MHCGQVMQLALTQPRPTVSPTWRLVTWLPMAPIRPIASCPGTNGNAVIPHSLLSIDRSEWQMPQAVTLISTWSGPSGPGS